MTTTYTVNFACPRDVEYIMHFEEPEPIYQATHDLLDDGKENVTLRSLNPFYIEVGGVAIYPTEEEYNFAEVEWSASDVQRFKPEWSEEKANDFLFSAEPEIYNSVVEAGYNTIKRLLTEAEE